MVAIVTGAGRGIGARIAEDLVAEGATVFIPDLDGGRSDRMAATLGAAAIPAQLDVCDGAAIAKFFARVDREAGGAALLINCAGGYVPLIPTLKITEDEYDLVMDSNLKGTFLCCQAAIAQMVRKRQGAIVNFSSLAGRQTSPALGAHYTAAKAGVAGLEFLSGIPGTIGGSLRMNAGAMGGETFDNVVSVRFVDQDGNFHERRPIELDVRYRVDATNGGIIAIKEFTGVRGLASGPQLRRP